MTLLDATAAGFPARVNSPKVTIFADRCAGCQECIVRCPADALDIDDVNWIATVDPAICVGCRQCERTCPFSAISVEGDLLVGDRHQFESYHPSVLVGNVDEVRVGFATLEEAQREAARCLACPDPTCVRGCPTHNDIPGFLAKVREGDIQGARDVLARTSCLSGACARVCDWTQQCEGSCSWALAGGEGVAIGKIERFVADFSELPDGPIFETATDPRTVAVIGGGPAGLGAAFELTRSGVQVELYEANSSVGGVMDWGIPDYVLPRSAWSDVPDYLERHGVKIHLDTPVHADELDALRARVDAVVLATGATKTITPPLSSLDAQGVISATEFLARSKALLESPAFRVEDSPYVGYRIVILGAGNTAMDVARSSLRLGASAIALDWMDERFTRARRDELAEARAEGVDIRFLHTVVDVNLDANGLVSAVTVAPTEQSRRDVSPRLLAERLVIDADLVVLAMGYRVAPEWLDRITEGLRRSPLQQPNSLLPADWRASGLPMANDSLARLAFDREWSRGQSAFAIDHRLWAVGDVRVGPSTVVTAMAQGMNAARGVLAQFAHEDRADSVKGSMSVFAHVRRGEVVVVFDGPESSATELADSLARRFEDRDWEVSLVRLAKLTPAVINEADVVALCFDDRHLPAIGSPSTRRMLRKIQEFPSLVDKDVVVLATSNAPRSRGLQQCVDVLTRAGAKVISRKSVDPALTRSVTASVVHEVQRSLAARTSFSPKYPFVGPPALPTDGSAS
ncbi:MAG: FAD-dependent oxidoreductase [Acidimicrobiales bacterium]